MRAFLIWPVIWALALPAFADARMTVLVDVLALNEVAQILRLEGMQSAQELNDDMLSGEGGPGWQHQVDAIYAPGRMVETVRRALEDQLEGEKLEQTVTFFASDLGTRIISLENSARAAISDPDVEKVARDHYETLEGTDDARLALIRSMVASGDMIDRNVTSAMNSNYQFLRGIADGGAVTMTQQEMLDSVTADAEEITKDTTSWLFGYLLLAYHPLSDDDLRDYLAYANTDSGQALNRGLFDGFGKAYEDISYALGRAVALNMTAEEL